MVVKQVKPLLDTHIRVPTAIVAALLLTKLPANALEKVVGDHTGNAEVLDGVPAFWPRPKSCGRLRCESTHQSSFLSISVTLQFK